MVRWVDMVSALGVTPAGSPGWATARVTVGAQVLLTQVRRG